MVEPFQEAADVIVHRLHARQVILHVTLIFPTLQFIAPQHPLFSVDLHFHFGGLGVQPFLLGGGVQTFRRFQLEIAPRQILKNLLRTLPDGVRPRRVIIMQGRRLGNRPVREHQPVLFIRIPFPVRRFVMAHQEKWLVLRTVLQEIDRKIRDDIRHISVNHPLPAALDKRGVEIHSLAGQYGPFIKPRRVAPQMPFADHSRVITGRLEILRHRGLRTVKPVEGRHTVEVAVFPRQNRRPARRTNRIDTVHMIKPHPLIRQPVQMRRLIHAATVSPNRPRRMIVGHDEQYIGPAGRLPHHSR